MRAVGNDVARGAHAGAPNKPAQGASAEEKLEYVRNRYECKLWGPVYSGLRSSAVARGAEAGAATSESANMSTAPTAHAAPAHRSSTSMSASNAMDAKRLPAATKAPADLMSLDFNMIPATQVPAALLPAASAATATSWAATNWASWDESVSTTGDVHRELRCAEPFPKTSVADAYDAKKQAVLAHFAAANHMHAPVQGLAPSPFFATYGL
jgi:hypothetical protein